jgi:hypothetical protein
MVVSSSSYSLNFVSADGVLGHDAVFASQRFNQIIDLAPSDDLLPNELEHERHVRTGKRRTAKVNATGRSGCALLS